MLAVTFGLEKFRHYTYGRDVTVITDHKPLTSIVKKPLSKAPKRLQNLLLRAQEYNYNLIYKAGSSIPVADALSRIPIDVAMVDENEYVSNLFCMPISDGRVQICYCKRFGTSEIERNYNAGLAISQTINIVYCSTLL